MTYIFILGKPLSDRNANYFISKLIYLSYRCNFPAFTDTYITSDTGWGCTIRSAQMLLANTLLISQYSMLNYNDNYLPKTYYNIISYFRDHPANLFSIHRLVKYYGQYGKSPGDWIGPYTACDLLANFSETIYSLYSIKYNCAKEGNITLTDFNIDHHKYLITVPIRLGVEHINSEYHENILYLTRCTFFMGIIGGENNKSYYFIGSDDDKLVYLDPHSCQMYSGDTLDLPTYRSSGVKYLSLHNLSPTLSICFFIHNQEHLDSLNPKASPTSFKFLSSL